jgi:hypothetical protein
VYAQLFCKAVAIGHAQLQRHKLLMKQFPKRTPYNCQQGIVIKPHPLPFFVLFWQTCED